MSMNSAASVNLLDEVASALDLQHLNTNTFGDLLLRAEILALFSSQIDQSRVSMLTAASPLDWRFLTHTLKGAASAVGAIAFAELAARWEKQGLPEQGDDRSNHLTAYDAARDAYLEAVRKALG